MLELYGSQNSMEVTLLIKSFIGLVTILGVLIFFLFFFSQKKKKLSNKKVSKKTTVKKVDNYVTLDSLLKIIKNKKSTTKELSEALDLVIKYHGTIHPKLGLRAHPDFDTYGEIILRICRHPNTSKSVILNFDKALEAKNEEYKKDINDFITKGLNSRGA